MRNPESYDAVFSENVSLNVWPVIVDIIKRSEEVLEKVRPQGTTGERFLARSRNLLGLLVVARAFGTFSYSVDELIALNLSTLTTEFVHETWAFIKQVRSAASGRGTNKFPTLFGAAWRPRLDLDFMELNDSADERFL